ncbi:MAG: glutamate-5-semialdehyde dehydrogenase [Oligoflexia bacterium]|nr:glutamate-5-semialdehyde dehydrogenase [Oligoflexia bacterium]
MITKTLSKLNFQQGLSKIKSGAEVLRNIQSETKNLVLTQIADEIWSQRDKILSANHKDLKLAKGHPAAFIDRLTLNTRRLETMIESLREIVKLSDPVGEVVETKTLSNGLKLSRVRAPLGVLFMIFESRPNVALEAFSIAFKSGNAIILKGGRESKNTVEAIFKIIDTVLSRNGLPTHLFWGLSDFDRKWVLKFLKEKNTLDVVIPRGGDALIDFVVKNSLIPIIKNDRGLCHIYVHEDADIEMALKIIINAKTQRPGVCNAVETILIHNQIASKLLPQLHQMMPGVQFVCDSKAKAMLKDFDRILPATKKSWDTEYLDLFLNVCVVETLKAAVDHIRKHGSRHSESIIARDQSVATEFISIVDAAAVYWNASTRFTDGFEMGLGGEIGISTQKLHVRGPVGLKELTSCRWVGVGNGQVRV